MKSTKKIKALNLTKLILQKIAEHGVVSLGAFFPKKYPECQIWRELLGLDSKYKFSKNSFSAILTRLQRQGLIERNGSKKNSIWKITLKGKKHLDENKKNKKIKEDGIIRLVCFDIAEKERKKRGIIREHLISNNYTQLQKSVWLGKTPLPKNFLHTLRELNILKNVHIFSIEKSGTLI